MKKISKIVILAAVLVFAVALAGCSQGGDSSSKSEKKIGTATDGNEVKIETASMNLVKAVDEGKYNLVDTEELKGWIDNKEDMIIIDTMPKKSFDKNRIPGAKNAELPVKMEDVTPEQKDAFLKAIGTDTSKKLVIYCGFVGCERSHVGALIAQEAGFTNVYRQPGGIAAWMAAGYDVESAK